MSAFGGKADTQIPQVANCHLTTRGYPLVERGGPVEGKLNTICALQFCDDAQDGEMRKRVSLAYELYGSISAGEKGYWRWVIVSPRSKKTLQLGSFYGPLPEAKRHAEGAVLRLQQRIEKGPSVALRRPTRDHEV